MINEPLAKRLPGEDGVWAFVLGDMIMFTMFFATFLFYRVEQGELFSQSQALFILREQRFLNKTHIQEEFHVELFTFLLLLFWIYLHFTCKVLHFTFYSSKGLKVLRK